ncbi:MAG: ATP-binding protein [Gammaproteobacteria bacterium]|nr:ATP-binding protein [Gammaproteobacteria bacterium]
MADVGADIFQLITLGMYSNPLAMYREYLQNSADSFTHASSQGGLVEIRLNRPESAITIFDNGPGLSPDEAVRALVPIAKSQKRSELHRGFRGIGRLSGLAYADSVTFLTRSKPSEPVTAIAWDGARINEALHGSPPTWDAISEGITIEEAIGQERPEHFFEVRIKGIARHAASTLLNAKKVRDYIGEVCTVPLSNSFPYSEKVEELFRPFAPPMTLRVEFSGAPEPITRPHQDRICFSHEKHDRFNQFEPIIVPAFEGSRAAAAGWVLHSSYLGAIPKHLSIRGIRARVGNIQVGDEAVFDHLFPEERFNRWCVGEVHILDTGIVPNGRRDYFEQGPRLRHLENHLGAICRKIADRCRRNSKERNRLRRLESLLTEIQDACELASSGYLAAEDAIAMIEQMLARVRRTQATFSGSDGGVSAAIYALEAAEKRLSGFKFEARKIPAGKIENTDTLQGVFRALMSVSKSPTEARETIGAVLKELERDRAAIS